MKFIEFPLGGSTLSDGEIDKLNKLSKALVERPNLKLDIPLHAVVPEDDDLLAKAALEQALSDTANARSRKPKPVSGANSDPAARLKALTALYQQKLNKDPEFPADQSKGAGDSNAVAAGQRDWLEQQLLVQFKPTADQRNDLGKARATAVQSAVLSNQELKPERVFLTERAAGSSDGGKARMELALQ